MARFLEPSFTDARRPRGAGARRRAAGPRHAAIRRWSSRSCSTCSRTRSRRCPDGGTVTIATGLADNHAYIDVQDDGPGLDAEAESNLFRPFSTTKGPLGSGLGLAVSRRLARMLGGDLVHVPSARGVRWRLTLPIEEIA